MWKPERKSDKANSQALHERVYQAQHQKGQMGWDADFDPHDLDVLMASRYAPRPGRLLDLGCGGGETSVYFAKLGFDVTALEFSQTALSLARRNADAAGVTIEFVESDMTRTLPFADEAFDTAIDHRAFHCVVDAKKRAASLAQFRRVLSPGGFLLCSTIAGLPHEAGLLATVDRKTRINRSATRYFGEAEDILKEVRAAGFDIAAHQLIREPFVVDNLIIYARAGA